MNLGIAYQLVRRFEGLRLKPYLCPAGIPTIGYGSTGKDITLDHPPVTLDWAEERMRRDVQFFAGVAIKLSPKLSRQDTPLCVITDFIYNLGSTRYAASTLRKRINASDFRGAAHELKKWVWGGGKKLPGLILRREIEAGFLIESMGDKYASKI